MPSNDFLPSKPSASSELAPAHPADTLVDGSRAGLVPTPDDESCTVWHILEVDLTPAEIRRLAAAAEAHGTDLEQFVRALVVDAAKKAVNHSDDNGA